MMMTNADEDMMAKETKPLQGSLLIKQGKRKREEEKTENSTASASSSSAPRGCPFLDDASTVDVYGFGDAVLSAPMDLEDLARTGRTHGVCPYFGAKMALPYAVDVVVAPYSAVLSEESRTALGVDVQGAVLVVDEAHNLEDAIIGSQQAEVTQSLLIAAVRQMNGYLDRFRSLLSFRNARKIQILCKALTKLLALMIWKGNDDESDHNSNNNSNN
eukprot:CAMPEP_0175081000 /NCGR_PEP_ID=MMETSP0052_2-20121109/25867_1 /TAXON_ID=51329 ORGANISM="Polytomella parva, Strain SAG 63-3" /NCGR_SAMPLE_ID=MMETSP0052_2 /ASSEMBLY_ACC=CAM_ASM_000194 /LENGTH=215 /DNA_ID=CAMNT_0016351857 /DNA_START=1 /DNA_END=646 /DNA_ORIENTATION=-